VLNNEIIDKRTEGGAAFSQTVSERTPYRSEDGFAVPADVREYQTIFEEERI
jgi:hypothetical protein